MWKGLEGNHEPLLFSVLLPKRHAKQFAPSHTLMSGTREKACKKKENLTKQPSARPTLARKEIILQLLRNSKRHTGNWQMESLQHRAGLQSYFGSSNSACKSIGPVNPSTTSLRSISLLPSCPTNAKRCLFCVSFKINYLITTKYYLAVPRTHTVAPARNFYVLFALNIRNNIGKDIFLSSLDETQENCWHNVFWLLFIIKVEECFINLCCVHSLGGIIAQFSPWQLRLKDVILPETLAGCCQ